MPDGARSIAEILDELHAALENAPEIGDEGREALRRTAGEIREALDRPGDATGEGESLGDQLSAAVERFEVAHPQLTSLVGRIADALADLGI